MACGSKKPKRELVRIASSPEGRVSVDVTGKAPGRGAYVCGADCWDTALGRGRLARSLGKQLSRSDLESLREGSPEVFRPIEGDPVPRPGSQL